MTTAVRLVRRRPVGGALAAAAGGCRLLLRQALLDLLPALQAAAVDQLRRRQRQAGQCVTLVWPLYVVWYFNNIVYKTISQPRRAIYRYFPYILTTYKHTPAVILSTIYYGLRDSHWRRFVYVYRWAPGLRLLTSAVAATTSRSCCSTPTSRRPPSTPCRRPSAPPWCPATASATTPVSICSCSAQQWRHTFQNWHLEYRDKSIDSSDCARYRMCDVMQC